MPSTGLCATSPIGIGALLRRGRQLRALGHELARDRVVRVGGVDQRRHGRRERDGVARARPARVAGCRSGAISPARTRSAAVAHGTGDMLIAAGLRRPARRPEHLLDPARAGRQHDQPVEAERDAARLRHHRERGQEILVDRVALAIDALLLGHLGLEAAALLGRVGQLAEAVGELDAAGIELEALGHARDRAAFGRASAASATGYSIEDRRRGRGRDCGSIRSTSTRLNRSAQVSSCGDAKACRLRGRRPARRGRLRRPRATVASRSIPA